MPKPARATSARVAANPLLQSALPLRPNAAEHLDISTLEQWLWDAACEIRGATDAPKFKDFILPLVFFKRLSDVFDDEFAAYVTQYGSEEVERAVIEADHADVLATGRKPIVRFYIAETHNWRAVRHHRADGWLGEFVTDAFRKAEPATPESPRWNGRVHCWRSCSAALLEELMTGRVSVVGTDATDGSG